jgi:hypothetical protein
MRAAHGAAVDKPILPASVNRRAQPGVATHVDVDRRPAGGQAWQCFVVSDLVVAAETAGERHVGRRSEADDTRRRVPAAPRSEAIRESVRGLARRAGDQHGVGAEQRVVGEEVVDEK